MLRLIADSATGNQFSVQDIRALQKKLKDIEPELRKRFMREVKSIGKEPQQAIQKSIKNEPPLSGLNPMTRGKNASLQWGKVKKGKQGANSTTIRFRTQAGGKSLNATLLAIRVNSAASSVADMAGRSGSYVGAGYKGSGMSKPIRRRYADGGESVEFRRTATRKSGLAFVRNLNERLANQPSRMAWKAVEKDLPQISKSVQFVVDKWAIQYSKGF